MSRIILLGRIKPNKSNLECLNGGFHTNHSNRIELNVRDLANKYRKIKLG